MRAPLAAVAMLTILECVTALAATGYSVRVRADSPVTSGHSFSIKTHGVAKQKALLYVYLDRKPCGRTWEREAQRVNVRTYKSGQSYFVHHDGGPRDEGFDYAWVSGSFHKSFTAHAGMTDEREYACAYLATPNKYGGYRINAASASARYTVTK